MCAPLRAQQEKTISAPLWVYYEGFPLLGGLASPEKIKEELIGLGSYLMSGMLYGWDFSYTPSDKTRGVEEFFEIIPVYTIKETDPNLFYTDIKSEYPKITTWVRYNLDTNSVLRLKRLSSIEFTSSSGSGTGDVSLGLDGVFLAYKQALLYSIRGLAQKESKNKPKEITGEIFLKDNPRIYVKEGLYTAEIKTLIVLKEIIPYRLY